MPRKRSSEQITRDQKRIEELTLKGWGQNQIAQEIGVSQPTVARDLEAIEMRYRRDALRDFTAHQAHELARLDELEFEAWQAWEASKTECGLQQTVALVDNRNNAGPRVRRYRSSSKSCHGNPRFMNQILKIVTRRCKLLGLDKTALLAPKPCHSDDPRLMTAEERARHLLEIFGIDVDAPRLGTRAVREG